MSGSSLFSSLGAALQALPSPLVFHAPRSNSTVHPATTHPLLSAFENRLSSQLQSLQVSDPSSYLTAEWFHQALDVSLSANYHMEKLFPQIQEAVLDENCKWVNEHLDDTVKLLDACNVLRESISDIKQYEASVQLAIHCLEGKGNFSAGQLVRARNGLGNILEAMKKESHYISGAQVQQRHKLEKCSSMLRRMAEKLGTPTVANSSTKGNFLDAIYGSKAATVFVCGALVAALSFKSKRSLPMPHVGQYVWSSSLLNLHHKVKEEVDRRRTKGARALLQELDQVDSEVRSLYDLANRFITCKSIPLNEVQALELKQSVQNLKKCTVHLEEGMGVFEKQVNEMFRVLITSRMALLDILSYS
eukprot:Gb_18313 [translate_table: standard]